MNNPIFVGGVKIRMDQDLNLKPHHHATKHEITIEIRDRLVTYDVVVSHVNGRDVSFQWSHWKTFMTLNEFIYGEQQIYNYLGGQPVYTENKKLISQDGSYDDLTVLDFGGMSHMVTGYTLFGTDGVFRNQRYIGSSVVVENNPAAIDGKHTPLYDFSHVSPRNYRQTLVSILTHSSSKVIEIQHKKHKAVIHKGDGARYWTDMIITGDWEFLEMINQIIEHELENSMNTVCEDSKYIVSASWGEDIKLYELISGEVPHGFRGCLIGKTSYIYRSHYDLGLTIYNLHGE